MCDQSLRRRGWSEGMRDVMLVPARMRHGRTRFHDCQSRIPQGHLLRRSTAERILQVHLQRCRALSRYPRGHPAWDFSPCNCPERHSCRCPQARRGLTTRSGGEDYADEPPPSGINSDLVLVGAGGDGASSFCERQRSGWLHVRTQPTVQGALQSLLVWNWVLRSSHV